MAGKPEPILPLINRRAPILERIRDGRRNSNFAETTGRKVAEAILMDLDGEEEEEAITELREEFTRGLANGLGVPPEDIDGGIVGQFGSLFEWDQNSVLIGSTEPEENESDEDEDDTPEVVEPDMSDEDSEDSIF